MRLTEFLINEGKADVAKQSEKALQAVWAERDPDKKYQAAVNFINNMAFKDKIPKDLRTLEGMKGNNNKIDMFLSRIQLKGEGQGVVK